MDRFALLLEELSVLLDTPLYPDKRKACKLNINDLLHVQIEFQPEKEGILLACMIGEVSPGKFRENTLKDALKANWPYPLYGTLCYLEKENKLFLFETVSLENLTGQKLLNHLHAFIAKADSWRLGIERGQTSALVPSSKQGDSGIFGLRDSR